MFFATHFPTVTARIIFHPSEKTMQRFVFKITLALFLCTAGFLSSYAQSSEHVIADLSQAQWGPAPPLLPAGAQIAVLAGNPMGPGPYTLRLKFPAHYAIPAHSHPTDEHVVVISGALTFGMGDALAKHSASNQTLSPGGFALMPANMNHFAFTSDHETTIVLYGQGPVEFKYVNPADDPRLAKK
jgi:quercetin dioxygenase-like cupin family protein